MPPLYLVKKGKQKFYAQDEAERDRIVTELGGMQGVVVQRYLVRWYVCVRRVDALNLCLKPATSQEQLHTQRHILSRGFVV